MNFSDYQKSVKKTAIYPNQGENLLYAALGLAGEVGEVADKIKKVIRDHQGILTDAHRTELVKELGDVLWYLSSVASELDVSLDEVAETNIKKVTDRKKRGTLHGEGDNR